MFSADNNLFWKGDNIYFAGYSSSFETKLQQYKQEEADLNYDAYVYKYNFNASNQCLITKETKMNSVLEISETKKRESLKADGLFTLHVFDDFNPLSTDKSESIGSFKLKNLTVRSSRLLNTMIIPRPCAF